MVKKPETIPNAPGVYTFKRGRTPVYIGKAGNLKKRISSYFRNNSGDKVRRLREEATTLEWIEADSEIEALILEAELIKRHLPKFNVLLRDDKSYFYVVITSEKFPRIFVAHQPKAQSRKPEATIVGPFTSGSALFSTLRLLRRIFPYCTCKEIHKRPCLNSQIGRCPGYCCIKSPVPSVKPNYSLIRMNKRIVDSDIEHYRSNIRGVIGVLSGKRKRISSQLKRQMHDAAKKHEFEAAARLRDQINGLGNVFSHERVLRPRLATASRGARTRQWQNMRRTIAALIGTNREISRVEGYDISNVSGTAATGSMVVFADGSPAKSLYRKFKIKTVHQANDVAMHQEMMRRRLAHKEWGMPDLLVIDGGRPQLNAIRAVLRPGHAYRQAGNENIRLAALAKREEELYIEGKAQPVRLDSLPREVMLFFQHVRDESHRFAKKYHHKIREMTYREEAYKQK